MSAVAQARTIVEINSAYFKSKVLQSAVEIGLFEALANGPATAEAIAGKLGLRASLAPTYLDALASLQLLDKQGDRYANSQAATQFLLPDSPTYLGATMLQHARMHYHNWARLADTLRADEPTREVKAHESGAAFADHYADADRARKLMAHMDTFNGFVADELAGKIDWSPYRSFVDLGGARGNMAARLATAHAHMSGTVYDLPAIEPFFTELMRVRGTTGRVHFHAGDFFRDPLPEADVYIIGHVLHDWPVERRRELVARTYDAVRPGGILVIYDAMLDPAGPDATSLLQSLNCSMLRAGGSEYSLEEGRSYLSDAGYEPAAAIAAETITQDYFVVGRKPR
jgi:N,N-dimethyltransferase/O-methyltransferase